MKTPQQDLRSLYQKEYFSSPGFQDESMIQYSRKEKVFNLEWASAWSGHDLLVGRGKTALDAGCGVGLNAFLLNELGYRVAGIDFSDYAVQDAKRRSQREGRQQMEWFVADLDAEPISGLYDLVICWEVIEHVRNPAAVLQKLYNALKPQGILVVTTPNRLGLSHLLLAKDPRHIHVHSSFWWAQKLRELRSFRWVCRSMIFWDHVLPWLRPRKRVMAHWLPVLGFRIRMAALKAS